MKQRRWAAFAAAGVLALAACGGDDSSSDDTPTPTSAASDTSAGGGEAPATTAGEGGDGSDTTDGGDAPTTTVGGGGEDAPDCTATEPGSELNWAVYAPASSLDPLQNSGSLVGGTDMIALYDVLMRWNPATNDWQPHLAESLTSNDDFTEWTLKLREGVTYSNGDVMVAQHVLDNMVRLQGQGRQAVRGLIARVDLENSSAPDDTTVNFKLFEPWSNFGYLLADAPGMVVNPAVGAAVDSSGTTVISNDPTGAGVGPYLVEKWAPGESPYLVLKARPDYWGGAPCIETVNMINIPQDQPKLESLELGELDVAFFRTQDVIEEARETGEYGEDLFLQSGGIVLLINQGSGTYNPVGEDVRFRRAVAEAINKEALSQRAYGGAMLISDGFMHEDSTWYTEGSPSIPYDPDNAKALVEELKGEGWDGKIRLTCPDTVPDFPVAVEAALEAVGMDVDAQVLDTNTQIAAVAVQKDYDLACWGLAFSDSAIVRQLSFNFASDSASNRIGYQSDEFDQAIDDLFAAPDDEARKAAILKMSELYVQDVPVAIAGAVEEGIMYSSNVTGIQPTQQSMYLLQDASIQD